MTEQIITRFPPSPTGYLHVGGARTAIFNWLYARHTRGRFVLRIEDTDKVRSTKESVEAIFEALHWLGIDWDEGPYFQSERTKIYQTYLDKLIETGNAYYCDCTPEEVEEMRRARAAKGLKPKYDGVCREKGLARGENTVVRFKAPLSGTTIMEDRVKGSIAFNNEELDDFVLQRKDGGFTYNFVVVIDDIDMGINTIIRGDDHVSNTPKQILIYRALEADIPVFAHVPMVLGQDRTRLSKRHGAMSVGAYREMGYLPEAIVNYLVRLGWSHGDQEFFTKDELIEKFDLDHVGTSAGVFDMDKLTALNAEHIRGKKPEELVGAFIPFLADKGFPDVSEEHAKQIIETLIHRSKTLVDMAEQAEFYLKDEISYEEKADNKFLKPDAAPILEELAKALQELDSFDEKSLESAFLATMEKTGLKLGKIAQPVRVALTGKTASPGIFEVIHVLGREKTISRLKKAVSHMQGKQE